MKEETSERDSERKKGIERERDSLWEIQSFSLFATAWV